MAFTQSVLTYRNRGAPRFLTGTLLCVPQPAPFSLPYAAHDSRHRPSTWCCTVCSLSLLATLFNLLVHQVRNGDAQTPDEVTRMTQQEPRAKSTVMSPVGIWSRYQLL
jgi:hypothetical protein